jgi:hypothetical protein
MDFLMVQNVCHLSTHVFINLLFEGHETKPRSMFELKKNNNKNLPEGKCY